MDPDSPSFSVQNYRLVTNSSEFELKTSRIGKTVENARLILKQPLDREKKDVYTLTVIASDGGEPSKTGTLTVSVFVSDANDNSPIFEHDTYEVYVPEDLPLRAPFLKVRATDADDGLSGKVQSLFNN